MYTYIHRWLHVFASLFVCAPSFFIDAHIYIYIVRTYVAL